MKHYKGISGFLRGELAYVRKKAAQEGRVLSRDDAERDVVNDLLAQIGGIPDRVAAGERPTDVILRLYQTSLIEDHKRALAHAMKWLTRPRFHDAATRKDCQ